MSRAFSSVASWISILTFIGLVINIYATHFRQREHLEAAVIDYGLSDPRNVGGPTAPRIDLALVNRGDVDARYVGSILYAECPPGSGNMYTYWPIADERALVKPKSIGGTQLQFSEIKRSSFRERYAEAGLDTSVVKATMLLEVRALDTHGRLLSSILDLRTITFWEYGAYWKSTPTDSLGVCIIPDGAPARRHRGELIVWRSAGFSFNDDGTIRNITFYPDGSRAEGDTLCQ